MAPLVAMVNAHLVVQRAHGTHVHRHIHHGSHTQTCALLEKSQTSEREGKRELVAKKKERYVRKRQTQTETREPRQRQRQRQRQKDRYAGGAVAESREQDILRICVIREC